MRTRFLSSIDPIFLWLIAGLSFFGLMILLSASGPVSFEYYSDSLYFFRRQIFSGLLPGALVFYVISRFDYRKLYPFSFAFLIVTIGLLVSVFIPGLGHTSGGSTSWVYLGPLHFQPSEVAKATFLIYASGWLSARGEERGKTFADTMPFFLSIAGVMGLLMLQPDTGTLFVLVASALAVYVSSGASLAVFGTISAFLGAALGMMIYSSSYRMKRFTTFLHPELDPLGIGYHINQAFLAIGSGGWFGLGYNQSRQKFSYLPEAHSDSVFAIMAEELGFVVCALFVFVFAVLIWRCFKIARSAPDDFGKYLCVGIGAWIGVQFFANIGSMIGLMPMTGVTLPFVSYGNSAAIGLFIGLGIVASVSRQSRKSLKNSL